MDDLSGRGLGSGLGLGRVDQGSSFTTTRSAAEQGEGVSGAVVAAADAAPADATDAVEAEFDAMLLILVRCAYTGSSSWTGVRRLNGAVVSVLVVGNSGAAQVSWP